MPPATASATLFMATSRCVCGPYSAVVGSIVALTWEIVSQRVGLGVYGSAGLSEGAPDMGVGVHIRFRGR